jgi:hypothetical protein
LAIISGLRADYFGRFCSPLACLGSFIIFYAISLMRPALVDAITGLRYVIIFAVSYGLTVLRPRLLREDFSGSVLFGKASLLRWRSPGRCWSVCAAAARKSDPRADYH